MKVRFITLGYISAVVLLCLILATSSHAAIDPDTAVAIWLMEDGEGDKVTEVTNNPAKLRGLLQGKDITWVDGVFGGAIDLGSAGDVMAVGKQFGEEAAPTDACTVMAWIQYREKIKTDLFQFQPGDPWDNRISVHFPWAEAGIIWQFGRPFGGPPGVDVPKNFEDDWHHVAFTGSDDSTEIWIDGEAVARGGGQQPFAHQAHGPWHVGGRTNASFDGKIDEVGVFDVALSEKDINTIMDQGLEFTILGVDPAGKVATAWGTIKARD